ncbi:uncharacterized protein LOC105827876 [Monomorium pharaonis]|uniref:uncharacterized protein LOC105827876 n=1 Tax=Monomorium pharaonis TaxID=307658 RepID=UPI00102E1CBE|nr:uncharacterized protein LOC105827876 [Monomorium pharaonis]
MDLMIELWLATAYVIGHQIYMFVVSLLGQLTVNHAEELFNAIYMSLWYKAPVTIQKLLLFIMQVSSKNIVLSLGGVFGVAMEGFGTVSN